MASPAAAARTSLRQAGYILILKVLGYNVCTQLSARFLSPSTCYSHERDSAHAMPCSA